MVCQSVYPRPLRNLLGGGNLTTIKLYKINDDKLNAIKTLGESLTIQCDFVEPFNILHPTIRLKGVSIENYNYTYIEDFGRYYFIEKPIYLYQDTCQFECSIDVLFSHYDKIKEKNFLIKRSETIKNSMLVDNERILQTNHNIISKPIGSNVINEENYHYYLTTNA